MRRFHGTAILLASLVGAAGAAVGCAPPYSQLSTLERPAQRVDREARANEEALRTLMARADANARSAPPAPNVVVLSPADSFDGWDLTRERAVAFRERGPHAVLGAVQIEPAYDASGHALGFELVSFSEGSAPLRAAGFRAGDVVRRLNGHGVLLPDALLAGWASVGEGDALEVEILRDGEATILRWTFEP